MGTVVTIDLFSESALDLSAFAPQLAGAVAALHHADEVFSLWRPESPMSRIRSGELSMADAPPVIHEVLDRCGLARELSGGWFDPWAMPGGIDPTGLVKGWAARRALEELRSSGADGMIVNAAGDIAVDGSPGAGVPFRVGILDPFDSTRLALVAEVDDAIATSGTYERGEHLVDPFAGAPGSAVASATVVGPELDIADALATALAVGGRQVLDRLAELEGYQALTIAFDGEMERTPLFPGG